jgi:hypothetical protein
MTRRADPVRINEARRAAVYANLTDSGLDAATADRWIDAWVLEAASRGLTPSSDYWDAAQRWIAEERAARRPGW